MNMNNPERNEAMELLAGGYDEIVSKINKLTKKIRNRIKCFDPLSLLASVTDYTQFLQINRDGKIQNDNPFSLRGVEYIQSILVAFNEKLGNKKPEEIDIRNLMADIENLLYTTSLFYGVWSAKATLESEYLSKDDIEYILESQLFGNVRGKRYQFQQTKGIIELLKPQEEVIHKVFGETVDSIAYGLDKLEYSLSSQRLNALKNLYESFKTFRLEAKGKSFEECEKLLEEHSNDAEGIRLRSICFGDATFNVKEVTGWNDSLIKALSWNIGEYQGLFCDDDMYAWWPINELPIQKRPFIIVGGVSYCFDYYSLFDNFYRAIQDAIFRTNALTKDNWQRQQKEASEKYVASLFEKIIPSAKVYKGNYYPIKSSTKQMDENDIIILYDECLIVIEVKAGKFTPRPAILDYDSHVKSFSDLIGKGNSQAERTINYIKSSDEAVFYNESKDLKFAIHNKEYKYFYSFVVTIDNMDAFECKIQHIHFLNVGLQTITINVDDLELYAEYFDSPLVFFHFLHERMNASSVKELETHDELEHLGLYISCNLYTEYVKENCTDGINMFIADGFCDELDCYFNGLHEPRLRIEKPAQKIPERLQEILNILEMRKPRGCVEFSSFLLDWAIETREQFNTNILKLINRQKELKRMIPLFVSGENMMYSCFVEDSDIEMYGDERRDKYLLANLLNSSLEECWRIDLSCDSVGHIESIEYKKLIRDDIGDDYEYIEKYSKYLENNRKAQIAKTRCVRRKIYPNDPCPCGSGKKYKKCCGK